MKHKVIESYKVEQTDAEKCRVALLKEVSVLLDDNDVVLGVPLESRVKSLESIIEKMDRKSRSIAHVIDLDDFIGLRVILLFKHDVAKTCALIKSKFDILEEENTANRLGDSQFGYQSNHLIARLPSHWCQIPSLMGLERFKIEIQVRTMSQHIWAAASHKLQYKQESNIPLPLKRTINRVSALLETVDLEFERFIQEREHYIDESKGELPNNYPLDVDVIRVLCEQMMPPRKPSLGGSLGSLMPELNEFNITTVGAFKKLIADHLEYALEQDRIHSRGNDSELGYHFSHEGLVRMCLTSLFGQEYDDYLMKKFKEDVKTLQE